MSSQYYSATAYVGTPHRNAVEVTIPLIGPQGPAGEAGAGAVESVNGQTGVVVLAAADVGAASTSHTHALSAITDAGTAAAQDANQDLGTSDDVTHRNVTVVGDPIEGQEGSFNKGLFSGNALELSTYTLPDPADELPYIKFNGFMSGSTALRPYSGSGNFNINLPDASGTIALTSLVGASAELVIACSDEATNLTTGTAKVTFRMPYAMTLSSVRASVNTAPTGSTLIVDINEGGSTILSTKLSIDASELTSTTAATAAVISDTALADDAEITIDIDQIGSTIAGKGLKVVLKGVRA
jgi:hypothetical protein